MATTTACAAAATGTGAQIPSADSWDGQGELEKAVKTDELDEWTVVKKKKGRGAKENDEHTKPKTKSSGRAHVASLTTINPFPNLLGPMRSEKKGDSEKSTDEDEDGPSAKVEGVKLVERASSIQEEPTGE